MKKLYIAIGMLGLIVVVFAGAFLLLNFRLMQSQTVSDSIIAASKSNKDSPLPAQPVTGLYVDHSARFAQSLQQEIKSRLENRPQVGDVTTVNLPTNQADIPLVFVNIEEQKLVWTPFYAASAYKVEVSYASNGDISFRYRLPVHFQSFSDEPAIQYQATYTIADRSTGLISSPGYQDYLVHQIADLVEKGYENTVTTN